MSQVRVSGNASGTGVLTVTSPNTNSNYTLTLPAETGTILTTATPGVPVNGPAFSAYNGGSQSYSLSTWTKAAVNSEFFDTNSNYDTTNYRFTPTVAGYYQVNAASLMQSASSNITFIACEIYKNGSGFSLGDYANTPSGSAQSATATNLIYLNGSTDYLEFYIYTTATSPFVTNLRFSASLARAA